MGRFKGLSGIKTNQGGLYFLEGNYLVEILGIKFEKNRKKQDMFIVEGLVVESDNEARGPGCKPSQVITIKEEYAETAWGNIKQFAGCMLGIESPDDYVPADGTPVDDFWDRSLEFMVSPQQPLKGTKVRLNCTQIETREKKPFTKHIWGPVVAWPEKQVQATA